MGGSRSQAAPALALTRVVTATRSAEADLAEAVEWYEAQSPGLGARFLDDVRTAVDRVALNPFQYQSVHRGARRAFLHRFPYALIYRLVQDEVRLLAVFHTSRNPRRWRGRL